MLGRWTNNELDNSGSKLSWKNFNSLNTHLPAMVSENHEEAFDEI